MSAAAEKAVAYLLRRIQRDSRLAYYFDPVTESFDLLTAAEAERLGRPVDEYREAFAATLKFEGPAFPEQVLADRYTGKAKR